jgi:hypothetical protein
MKDGTLKKDTQCKHVKEGKTCPAPMDANNVTTCLFSHSKKKFDNPKTLVAVSGKKEVAPKVEADAIAKPLEVALCAQAAVLVESRSWRGGL